MPGYFVVVVVPCGRVVVGGGEVVLVVDVGGLDVDVDPGGEVVLVVDVGGLVVVGPQPTGFSVHAVDVVVDSPIVVDVGSVVVVVSAHPLPAQ